MSDASNRWAAELNEGFEVLKMMRDELKVQLHLAGMDAKARFSEVVRKAQSEGPQRVTVRGEPAVVVIDAAELERLVPTIERQPLVQFLEGLDLDGLNLTRERDPGRDVDL